MKAIVFLFLSVFAFQNFSIIEIRKSYQKASDNKQNALVFFDEIKNYSGNNQTFLAYKGASFALQSKFVGTKESKKENFIKGVGFIDKAIISEPNNLELRIIRLSVQENTPKMMKYKMNINEDKNQIVKLYDSQNNDIKQLINSYIKTSTSFSETEKNKLK